MPKVMLLVGVCLLLGSPVSADDAPISAARMDRVQDSGKTALMAAAKEADLDRVRLLIKQGVDVNQTNRNGGTPLMYAALNGNPDTISMLLQHNANVDAVALNGWTALMLASVKGNVDAARLLLNQGADPNRADIYSWTPLMRAVYQNRPRIVELLVQQDRVRVNQLGENGVTALHLAVLNGDSSIIKLLVAGGADPDIKDNSGRTPLDFARQNGNQELARLIRPGSTQ